MRLAHAALVALIALAFSVPAEANPRRTEVLYSTGLHANDVEPIVKGIAAQGVQVAVFATCFLALDDNATCLEISAKARAQIEG